MTTLYLVWNTSKTECVGFLDKFDARWTARGGQHPFGSTPTVGYSFREAYGDDAKRLPQTEVEIADEDDEPRTTLSTATREQP